MYMDSSWLFFCVCECLCILQRLIDTVISIGPEEIDFFKLIFYCEIILIVYLKQCFTVFPRLISTG